MPRPWPENRPFVAKVDYQPTNTYRIPLHKNDLGRVVKQDGEQCFVIIESRGKPGEKPQGWIPTRLITIGDVEYATSVEELSLESGLPNASTAASNVKFAASTDGADHLIKKAMLAMLTAWASEGNSGLLGVVPDWINKLSTRRAMQSYVNPIFEGIPGPLRNVFSSANFNLENIRQNAKKVTGSEHGAGVYMIVVAKFKKGSTYEGKHPHIYIGKTIHFEQRLREHRNATRSKQAVHRAWRESSDHEMYIICRLEGQGHEDERKRIAAEQLFTCLFETYDPILLDPNRLMTGFSVEQLQDTASADETPSSQELDGVVLAQSMSHWKRNAALLQYYARSTWPGSGWRGGVSRREAFGVWQGLNWTSPVSEVVTNSEKVLWLKTTYPGVEIYRRAPLGVTRSKSASSYLMCSKIQKHHYKTNGKRSHYDSLEIIFPGADVEPVPGTQVQTVVEIFPSGQRHPIPWARLPGAGPYSDWGEANRVGIKVEWMTAQGAWRQKYVQHRYGGTRDLSGMTRDGRPGGVQAYGKALALIHYFNHEKWPTQSWPDQFGLAHIREVEYDHLEQKIRIKDGLKGARPIQAPIIRTRDSIVQEFTNISRQPINAGPTKVAGAFRQFPPGATIRTPRVCDGCQLEGLDTRRCSENKTSPHGDCTPCYRLGIPCTWSDNAVLSRKPHLRAALLAPAKDPRAITSESIDDPAIVLLGADDLSDSGDEK